MLLMWPPSIGLIQENTRSSFDGVLLV
jgi:hypothetical protein